jgi:UDP-N-acetylmuramoyl-L-alanyl-D-glutamate--2,6-diaminopimelate ligase
MGVLPAATGQMTLRHLVETAQLGKHGLLSEITGDEVVITDVMHDSRQVAVGALFCCVDGENEDGHAFAEQAIRSGATALLVNHVLPVDAPQVVVRDVRMSMGLMAAALRNYPSTRMHVVGITGTNGKTTTAHLLAEILRSHGWKTEVIGTLTGARTTPESTDLQRLLSEFEGNGVEAVVMEVTSHALELYRVAGTTFDVSVFTNLSQDHLDFHLTMEKYFAAKAKLFTNEYSKCGVVNRDDVHGQLLLDTMTIDSMSFGISDVASVLMDARHLEFDIDGVLMSANLGGQFNVMNSLAAVSAARALGISLTEIAEGLSRATAVPGRFESVDAGQSFEVIVDYAHTPDALERVLDSSRSLMSETGKLFVVFGCGGDRDMEKRQPMGEIAGAKADVVIITSDNPRSESGAEIALQINAGVRASDSHKVLCTELDRRAAIGIAFSIAQPGDVVVIAGKGHENTQTIGTEIFPFNDAQVARELLGAQS